MRLQVTSIVVQKFGGGEGLRACAMVCRSDVTLKVLYKMNGKMTRNQCFRINAAISLVLY